jgi:ABC-type iron transport system FetAB ATPase subunit
VPFRALVIAPSGSGKSFFKTNLITLFCKGTGNFDNIYIFCKSRDEPIYKYIADKSEWLIEVHEDLLKLPTINDLKSCNQTLIIFDDMVTDLKKHPIISECFIRGRKKPASIIFLIQSY